MHLHAARGRGLAVTRDVAVGELLLVSAPLGILEWEGSGEGAEGASEEDEGPENEELADLLMSRR